MTFEKELHDTSNFGKDFVPVLNSFTPQNCKFALSVGGNIRKNAMKIGWDLVQQLPRKSLWSQIRAQV